MVSINEDDDSVRAVSIMWINKNRRFFGGNAEPVTAEDPLYHVSWHQLAEYSDNLEPELVETFLNMPVTI